MTDNEGEPKLIAGRDTSARPGGALAVILVVSVMGAAVCAIVLAATLTGEEGKEGAPAAATVKPQGQREYVFVPFGSVVVNISREGGFFCYLKVNITLKVEKMQVGAIDKVLKGGEKAILKNWLILYLSDLTVEDVKGSGAINRLRREILDGFNAVIADYGSARIEDVLFEEFRVE